MNEKFIDDIYESKTGVTPKIFDDVKLEEKQDVNFKDLFLKVGSLEFRAKALSFDWLTWQVTLIVSTCIMTGFLITIYLS